MQETHFYKALDSACETLGVSLEARARSGLFEYWQMFIKWNGTYNLSAIRDPEQILYKHLVDSLAIVPAFVDQPATRCLDVGTGGGLPGIPLALCFPETEFTLLDSAGKKIRFLFQVKQALGLANLQLENRRVESLPSSPGFDRIVSRAFASLARFTGLCEHLLSDTGEFWAMKGVHPLQELSEIEKHYIVVEQRDLNVPGVEGERCLIKLRKRPSVTE